MKKFILFIAVSFFISLCSFGQAKQLIVDNTSSHTIYFNVIYSISSATHTCTGSGTSSILAIPPMSSLVLDVTFPPSAGSPPNVPGMPTPYSSRWILAMNCFEGPTACSPHVYTIGHPGCGYLTDVSFHVYTSTCTDDGAAHGTWQVTGAFTARVTFTNI